MKYDLLLTGGEVVDPAAGLRGVMDIGIAGGKIVAVGPSLAAAEARRTIGAKGRLVTPGLVDIHAHIFVNAHDMAGDTDRFCRASGVTTLCDAERPVRTGAAPGIVQVGGGCGPGWHPVPGHWSQWRGEWVPPHCAPNRYYGGQAPYRGWGGPYYGGGSAPGDGTARMGAEATTAVDGAIP